MMEGLGSEHRFSPESYQRQLEELYTITNNRVDTLETRGMPIPLKVLMLETGVIGSLNVHFFGMSLDTI